MKNKKDWLSKVKGLKISKFQKKEYNSAYNYTKYKDIFTDSSDDLHNDEKILNESIDIGIKNLKKKKNDNYIRIYDNVIDDELCDYFIEKQKFLENDYNSCYHCINNVPFDMHICLPYAQKGATGGGFQQDTSKTSIDSFLNDTSLLKSDDVFSKNTEKIYLTLRDYVYPYLLNVGHFGHKYVNIDMSNIHEYIKYDTPLPNSTGLKIHSLNLRRYPPEKGGYHVPHCDWSVLESYRVGAVILYLNDVKKGGETEFPVLDVKIKPKKGRLAIFPPYYTHMHFGNKASTNKFAIVGHITNEPKEQGEKWEEQ